MTRQNEEISKIALKTSGAQEIADRLNLISGGKVLDVATGNGDFIRLLMKTLQDYDSFIGIDMSKEEIEAARNREDNTDIEFHEMNAEYLDFENDSFDTVCIANSLHHLVDVNRVLTEMKRVLKPKGNFLIQEMFSDGSQTQAQRTEILSHHMDAEVDSLIGVPHQETFTRKKIRDFVDGLKLEEVEVFEASRYVKCLYCEDWAQCEDPKNEELVKFALREIDEILARIEDHETEKEFKVRALQIKDRIRRFGSSPASILFVLGTKP